MSSRSRTVFSYSSRLSRRTRTRPATHSRARQGDDGQSSARQRAMISCRPSLSKSPDAATKVIRGTAMRRHSARTLLVSGLSFADTRQRCRTHSSAGTPHRSAVPRQIGDKQRSRVLYDQGGVCVVAETSGAVLEIHQSLSGGRDDQIALVVVIQIPTSTWPSSGWLLAVNGEFSVTTWAASAGCRIIIFKNGP